VPPTVIYGSETWIVRKVSRDNDNESRDEISSRSTQIYARSGKENKIC